ncbi:MAG TPA: hypothetical protein VHV76_14560 [Mycobacteriales bacterium]|nr:hypothetical protein [Mycobacteriales bacterium]
MERISGPDVVAAWGIANGALLAILIGYGENVFAVALYASSATLIEVIALVTWWVMRRHPAWAARSPAPTRTRASALAAAVVALIGVGLVWDRWMALPALYPLAALLADRDGPLRRLWRVA